MTPSTTGSLEYAVLHLRMLLDAIVPAVAQMPKMVDEKARMREAVIRNVRLQVEHLKKTPVIAAALARKEIAVIGTFYEISSGAVDFIEDTEPTEH